MTDDSNGIPDSIRVEIDDAYRVMYENSLTEDDRDALQGFFDGELSDRVSDLVEQAIHQQFQGSKNQ